MTTPGSKSGDRESNSCNDVFCGVMQRSGSTLQYNIAAEIAERSHIGSRATWTEDHDFYFRNNRGRGLIVFKSHRLSQPILDRLAAAQDIVLCCHRDVRDAAASFQAKSGRTLSTEEALSFASWAIEDFSAWELCKHHKKVISRYEDMISDPQGEIQKVSKALDACLDDELVDQINRCLTPLALQEKLAKLGVEELDSNGKVFWDPITLLHTNHLNGGANGRGKRELTREAFEAISSIHQDWLIAHQYDI